MKERVNMGISDLMKYAAKGAAIYAGYLIAKPALVAVNNARKKTSYNFIKSFKKPNEKK